MRESDPERWRRRCREQARRVAVDREDRRGVTGAGVGELPGAWAILAVPERREGLDLQALPVRIERRDHRDRAA